MQKKLQFLETYHDFEFLLESSDGRSMFDKLKSLSNKIKKFPEKIKKRYIMTAIVTLLSVMYFEDALELIEKLQDPEFISAIYQVGEKNKKVKVNFKDIDSLGISKKGINFIKKKEQLRLKAYTIGDGKITIGWGHAEDIDKSEYKPNQSISIKEANKLLEQDLQIAANGVKRNLKNLNKDLKITQDQFDVLVSLAFNKGVSGLFKESYIKDIMEGKFIQAAKKIRRDYKAGKFAKGHAKRRKLEANLFLSFLEEQNNEQNNGQRDSNNNN